MTKVREEMYEKMEKEGTGNLCFDPVKKCKYTKIDL